MQVIPLTTEEAANSGFTHKIILTYQDAITLTSGTGASILPDFNSANNFPNGLNVYSCALVVKTPFAYSGANNGTLTMSVGDSNSATRFTAAKDMKGSLTYAAGVGTNMPFMYDSGSQILATFTAATQAITALVAGEVHVYLGACPMATLDR